jgi:ABC-2 type transport system ATP-binding protein
MTADRPASIEAQGLVREFKKGPRAVDGIDLYVAPGEIYGFLGPTGAYFFAIEVSAAMLPYRKS